MKLHEIRQRIEANRAEMRKLLNEATGHDVEGEARTRYDALEAETATLETRETREARLVEIERRRTDVTALNGGTGLSDLDRAIDQFDVRKLIAAEAGIRGVDAAREYETCDEMAKRSGHSGEGILVPMRALERRTLVWNAGAGSGAGLVAEQSLANEFISPLRASLVLAQRGARIIDGLVGGPVTLPKLTTDATGAWVAEDSPLTPQTPGTGKVQLNPKHCGGVVPLSRNMLIQTSPAATATVSEALFSAVTRAIDSAGIEGGGAAEPSGIFDQVSPTALGEPTWEEILGLIEDLQLANVGASLGWVAHPSAVRKLRSTPKLQLGSPVTETVGGFIMENASTLADYALSSSTLVPTTGSPPSAAGLAVADFSQLVIGTWESATLLINPYSESDFLRGGVSVRVLATVDIALRHTAAFKTATISI